MEADHRSVLPQCLRALLELHYGDTSVNPQGPSTGPVVNLPIPERCLLSYRDPPSRQTLPTLLSQRHLLAVHSTAIRVVNQSESIYQNIQTCTSLCPPPSGKAAHLDDWLLNPGTRQEAHEQTSWFRSLCQKLGLVINLEKSDLIPSQVSTYLGIELDTSVGLARPSLKRLTNWLSVAEGFTAQQSPPAVQWLQVLGTPSLSRETSALWSNSHSSHSMAIETPVEPVEGEILKTDPTRPSVPPGHPMVDQQGQFTKGSSIRDHRCGVLPVYRQQYSGLGCPFAGSNCIWHLAGPFVAGQKVIFC